MRKLLAGVLVMASIGFTHAYAAAPSCERDRACLERVLNNYLQALLKHDVTALPTTRNIKYTENGVRLAMGDGLWQTATAMPTYRLDVIDEEDGQVGMLGRIREGANHNWFAVRLKVEPGALVSEIEVLSNRSTTGGGGGGAAPAPAAGGAAAAPRIGNGPPPAGNLADPHPLMAQVIPADRRSTRAALVAAGDAYFSGLDTWESGENVPFSPECQRRENGTITSNNPAAEKGSMVWMDCKAQFDTGFSTIVTDIRERRFEVVDRTKGLAFGWGYFDHNGAVKTFARTRGGEQVPVAAMMQQPFSFYIAEVFKVVDGKIRQIEAVLTTVPYQMESGW